MGRDRHRKEKDRLPPFVPMLTSTLDVPAWKATSHGSRSLYMALKRRYSSNFKNNGKLFLSQRDASREIGSHHNEVARWFRELQHFGFIVQTTAGSLGVEGKGKAPHWRLTELGYMHDMPTRDFDRWNGQPFRDPKTESRAGNGARGVPEMAHTTVPEMAHTKPQKRAGNGAHTGTQGVPEMAHITSSPLSTPTQAGALQQTPTDEGPRCAPTGERASGPRRGVQISTPTPKPSSALLESPLVRRAVAEVARGGAR